MLTEDELERLDCAGLRTLLAIAEKEVQILLQELARRRVERMEVAKREGAFSCISILPLRFAIDPAV